MPAPPHAAHRKNTIAWIKKYNIAEKEPLEYSRSHLPVPFKSTSSRRKKNIAVGCGRRHVAGEDSLRENKAESLLPNELFHKEN
jgi:hypothetical protein